MSILRLNPIATPAAPAAGKMNIYLDTADGKVKTIDSNGIISALPLDGWRDRPVLYNSGFEFAQRQAPGTLTTYSLIGGRTLTADRWWISNENTSVQYVRVDTGSAPETGHGSRFYGSFSKLTNTGKFSFGQMLMSASTHHMRGSRCRVQFNLKASTNTDVRLGLIQLTSAGTIDGPPAGAGGHITAYGANGVDPTLGTALAYIAPAANTADGGTISGNAMTCSLTTSWKRFSCCFDLPTDFKNLSVAVWTNNQVAAGVVVSAGEAGLYEGPEIRSNFVQYSSLLEYLRIQKYYAKTFPLDVLPVQNGGVTGALRGGVAIGGAVATSSVMQWRFPVPMKSTPNLAYFNPSAANAFVRNVARGTDATVTASANATPTCVDINATGLAAWTAGDLIMVHVVAESEI
jgi:hypothetical protein